MKKANRKKLMYLVAGILTLIVVPAGAYNVITKQMAQPVAGKPFDKKCARKMIDGYWQKYGHVPYHMVDKAIASCQVTWEQYYLLHDEEVLENRRNSK